MRRDRQQDVEGIEFDLLQEPESIFLRDKIRGILLESYVNEADGQSIPGSLRIELGG